MKRQDTVLLFVLSVIGGILFLSILLLVIQFTNFQKAYSRELEEETKRNNFYLVRLFRDLLESDQLDKMQKMLSSGSHGPNPMIVKIIARGKGPIIETEGVPDYLAEHVRRPEIKGSIFFSYIRVFEPGNSTQKEGSRRVIENLWGKKANQK